MTSSVKWTIGGLVGAAILLLLFLWTAPGRQTGTVELDAGRWNESVNSHVNALSLLSGALTKYPKASELVVSYHATRHTQATLTYNRTNQSLIYQTEDDGGRNLSNVSESSIIDGAARGRDFDGVGGILILPTPAPDGGSVPGTGSISEGEA